MKTCILLGGLLAAVAGFGQSRRAELFDTSGMPRRPTMFVEQQIGEMLATHQRGDLADAARIQQKLGRYYADKGDEERATACFLAAAEAQRAAEGGNGSDSAPAPVARGPQQVASSKAAGSYFGYDGRTLHTWDFAADGTFLHTWIVSGAGTSVRNSERGAYRLMGNVLELKIGSSAGGFVTPGVGGRSVLVGGGSETSREVRRLTYEVSDNGVVLDGMKLKRKSW